MIGKGRKSSSTMRTAPFGTWQAIFERFIAERHSKPWLGISISLHTYEDTIYVSVEGMRVGIGGHPGNICYLAGKDLRPLLALCTKAVGRPYEGRALRRLSTQARDLTNSIMIMRMPSRRQGAGAIEVIILPRNPVDPPRV